MYSDWLKRCKVIITMVVVITFFGQTRTGNYATEHSAFAEQYYVSKGKSKLAVRAIDGNVNTCSSTASKGPPGNSTQQWWRVEFKNAIYIVGLIITIPVSKTAKFKGFSVQIGNTTGVYVTCYDHGTNESIESITEINCLQPVTGNTLRISLAEKVDPPLSLCEVEVYGGRLVSFNMPTQLNEMLEQPTGLFWNSSYAVDGKQTSDDKNEKNAAAEKTCTVVGGQNNSFIVMSGYKNSQDYQTLFTEESKPTDNLNVYYSKTKSFAIPVFGDIVRVEVTRPYLILCEFNVFAECPFGKCGWDCSNTCLCSSQTTGHNKIQGRCPYGCSGRWTGLQEKCNTHCSDTEWGPFCNMTCGQCKGKLACSVTDGTCPSSCEPGWKPPLCEDAESQVADDDQSLSLGIIVGPTVAVAIGVVVVISLLVIWKRRKSRASESSLYADYNASVTDVHVYDTLGARRETQHVYEAAKACTE